MKVLDEIKSIQMVIVSAITNVMVSKEIDVKELALRCGYSEKYLKQVLECNKPINFIMLAKIKKALQIKFQAEAHYTTTISQTITI